MYNIQDKSDPSDFQVGKGEAQVFDLKPIEEAAKYGAIQRERKLAEKQKQDQAQQEDVYKNIAAQQGKDIMSHDSDDIQAKQIALYDWAKGQGEKLWKGDPATRMQFNQKNAELQMAIATSVDKKKMYMADLDYLGKNRDKFLPDSYQNMVNFSGSKYAGQQYTGLGGFATPIYDFNKDAKDMREAHTKLGTTNVTDVTNSITGATVHTKTGPGEQWSLPEATEEAKKTILGNDSAIKNAIHLIKGDEAAQKFYGFDNENPLSPQSHNAAVDYLANRMAKNMAYDNTFRDESAGYTGGGNGPGGGGAKAYPKMAGTLSTNTNGVDEFLFDNKSATDIPVQEFIEEGKDLKGKPYKITYGRDAQGKPDPTMSVMVAEDKAKKIKGGSRELKWSQISPTMRHKYGLDNIYSIVEGDYPDNWSVKDERKGEAKKEDVADESADMVQFGKSKSGKDIISLDGGKTWKYK